MIPVQISLSNLLQYDDLHCLLYARFKGILPLLDLQEVLLQAVNVQRDVELHTVKNLLRASWSIADEDIPRQLYGEISSSTCPSRGKTTIIHCSQPGNSQLSHQQQSSTGDSWQKALALVE